MGSRRAADEPLLSAHGALPGVAVPQASKSCALSREQHFPQFSKATCCTGGGGEGGGDNGSSGECISVIRESASGCASSKPTCSFQATAQSFPATASKNPVLGAVSHGLIAGFTCVHHSKALKRAAWRSPLSMNGATMCEQEVIMMRLCKQDARVELAGAAALQRGGGPGRRHNPRVTVRPAPAGRRDRRARPPIKTCYAWFAYMRPPLPFL